MDIDGESIKHAGRKYIKENLKFLLGSTSKIPLEDNSVDIIISFETIEHHNEQEEMLAEFKRVLKDNGLVLLSSPEKSIYYERDPNNIYHIKELTIKELTNLTDSYFKYKTIFSQFYFTGSIILPENEEMETLIKSYDGDYKKIKRNLEVTNFYNQKYFNLIILCDNNEILKKKEKHISSLFNGYLVYSREIDLLQTKIDYLQDKYNSLSNSKSLRLIRALYTPFNFLKKISEK